ncbi:site-2 protease family protein [Acetobacterium woodii]|uniref:Putative zinc metalloprotease n=1 Tax=Acetobacterium woodii (strain ATCC 29683 / DSM 1030 / JCM 2381 / KCTC 1655 / WB1) TaxID=931626 RepID=H6LCH3_ACEWD|nr:site-2 protease family protein [Acetobacterium woodii]AFA47755.1 putative zinc metalloprotease [Acetobacterium woodii DSM 1030]
MFNFMPDYFNLTPEYFYGLLLSLPGILIAISFHEMAHGFAADAMGDPTPKNAGRLTLNPLKHIDPLGFISMLLFRFGWAKPVPVNPGNFKDRKKGMIVVALSGVLTNLLLAFLGMAAYLAVVPLNNEILMTVLKYIYVYNIMFAVFNIIPIPPLDGSQILVLFLPPKALMTYYKYQRYGMILIFVLAFTGLLGFIIYPAIDAIISLFSTILLPIFNLIWS